LEWRISKGQRLVVFAIRYSPFSIQAVVHQHAPCKIQSALD